jgi:hypothetical protein
VYTEYRKQGSLHFSFRNFEQIKETMEKPQKENIEDDQRTSATKVRK